MHFVHCFLPVAEGWAGEPRSASSRRVSSSSELDLPPGDPCEAGLLQLDVPLLRAQLRGSRLLDAMRMYRQGKAPSHSIFPGDCCILPCIPDGTQELLPSLSKWLKVSFLCSFLPWCLLLGSLFSLLPAQKCFFLYFFPPVTPLFLLSLPSLFLFFLPDLNTL